MVENLLSLGLNNALMSAGLAALAVAVAMVWRRPALVHSLWLLVLLKLITPPFVALPVPVALTPQSASFDLPVEAGPLAQPSGEDSALLP